MILDGLIALKLFPFFFFEKTQHFLPWRYNIVNIWLLQYRFLLFDLMMPEWYQKVLFSNCPLNLTTMLPTSDVEALPIRWTLSESHQINRNINSL